MLSRMLGAAFACILAAGLAPAVAFAAPEAEDAEAAPIELQASDADAWNAGTIVEAEDNLGNAVDPAGVIEFIADDNPHFVVPTKIKPMNADEKDILDGINATVAWYAYDSTTSGVAKYTAVTAPYAVNVYAAAAFYDPIAAPADIYMKDGVFYSDSALNYTVPVVTFEIVGQDIATADLYQRTSDPEDFGDTDYIFNGTDGLIFGTNPGDLSLTTGTAALAYGTDYSASFYKIEGASKVAVAKPVDAGTYEAVILGAGKYAGSENKIQFEVAPLDIDTLDLSYYDGIVGAWTEPDAYSLNYPPDATVSQTIAVENAIKAVTYKSGPAGSEYTTARLTTPGHFVYDVTLDAAAADVVAGNIVGSTTVEFDIAGEDVSYNKFFYDGAAMSTTVVETVLADDEPVFFDSALITIEPATGVTLDNSNITIEAFDYYTGKSVALDDILAVEGWYDVLVSIDPSTCDYKYAGTCWMEVKVTMDHISSANVFMSFDGANINFPAFVGPVEYDGSDFATLFSAEVKATDGTVLEEGVDYKVVLYIWDDEEYKWVETTEFVDAGAYMYAIEDAGLVYAVPPTANAILEIWPKEIYLDDVIDSENNYVEIMDYVDKMNGYPSDYWLQYQDGAAIVPEFGFYFGEDNEYGEPIYESLDPAEYKYNLFKLTDENGKSYATPKEIDEIAETGWYLLVLEANPETASGNYDLKLTFDAYIWVQDALTRFTDVDYDNGWYADYVTYVANTSNGAGVLMGGYAGTTIFGVGNTMLRSEVAQVLLNLAGQPSDPNAANMTPLKDVEDKMWYTTAINFAYGAGVITGYTSGDQAGNFGVYDNVSREQFATMLYRFAKTFAPSIYKEIDLDTAKTVLLNFDDGESVGDYAKPAMAWCIEKGIMSGYSGTANLGPQDTILREQVAKMVAVFDQANKGVL